MRVIGLLVLLCSVIFGAAAVRAQEAPAYPRPATKASCDAFIASYSAYLRELRDRVNACHRDNERESTFGKWVRIACHPVGVPRVCAAENERSACAHKDYGSLPQRCRNDAYANERREETRHREEKEAHAKEHQNESKRRERKDDFSRQVMLKTADGVPRVAGTNALRMANLLAGRGSTFGALAQTAKRAYGTQELISKLYAAYDPKQPPSKRLAAVLSVLPVGIPRAAFGNNILSQDMLRTAIAGLKGAHNMALDRLVHDLNAFSGEVSRENRKVISEAMMRARMAHAHLEWKQRVAREQAIAEARAKAEAARSKAQEQAQIAAELEAAWQQREAQRQAREAQRRDREKEWEERRARRRERLRELEEEREERARIAEQQENADAFGAFMQGVAGIAGTLMSTPSNSSPAPRRPSYSSGRPRGEAMKER